MLLPVFPDHGMPGVVLNGQMKYDCCYGPDRSTYNKQKHKSNMEAALIPVSAGSSLNSAGKTSLMT